MRTEKRMKPLAADIFCGLGGWTNGLLAEGWDVVGFDIERHAYGGESYPAQLVLQDARTIDGAQLAGVSLITASSPCQEFSYRAMPWKRAKALGPPLLGMELFAQAERIQREAIAAAGRFIPMVQENVRGAQPWVGRARWHYGSYYLWGDVPALMPITLGKGAVKVKTMGAGWYPPNDPRHVPGLAFNTHADRATREADESVKVGGSWFHDAPPHSLRAHSSKSSARKVASARIAKIPLPLAQWIARTYLPKP